MKHCLPLWLLLVLLMYLPGAALATAGPPATGRPLAEALNPDGTLRAGATGSFDARAFRMRTAPDGRPVFRPAGALGAGDERWASGFTMPEGTNGEIAAMVRSGNDLYVAGVFTVAGQVAASRVAKWNGTTWSSLGNGPGTGGSVKALAVAPNGDVYAAGAFGINQAAGTTVGTVARWNGTTWSMVGAGMSRPAGTNAIVNALAIAANGDVYAGGYFETADGVPARNVARWNGTTWSALGTGVGNGSVDRVNTMALAGNGELYVGGSFAQAGGAAANSIARWNGAVWNSIGTGPANGVNNEANTLAFGRNGEVYVGGYFSQAGQVPVYGVARWDGTAWSRLGTEPLGAVLSLVVAGNGDVYVGGFSFVSTNGSPTASNVARWNGSVWTTVGTGSSRLANRVYALLLMGNGDLYAGGFFRRSDGSAANSVAKWSGMAWQPLGLGTGNGLCALTRYDASTVSVASNGDVYAGGGFGQAGSTLASGVARWNSTGWNPLGNGVSTLYGQSIQALALAANGNVYAGGTFTQTGPTSVNRVGRWDGTAWNTLGASGTNGVNDAVTALAVAGNGDVYVGGYFTQAGGAPINYVAKWDGSTWTALGTGLANGPYYAVLALAVAGNGDVYAGGYFTQAGGVPTSNVARWNGTAWSSLGTGAANGTNGDVLALLVAGNGDVYAGGNFTQAGGVPANRIAKWNGSVWSSLGTGLSGGGVYTLVTSLALANNGEVYAGGVFTEAGGAPANNIAKWNGTVWNNLGSGTNGDVSGLAFGPDGKLYVTGGFSTTGDGSKVMVGFGIYDPAAPLATAAAKATPAAQLFPNPAHAKATLRLPPSAPRQPLTLSDAMGRPVRQYPAPASADAELDLRGLPVGVYVVRCGSFSQRLVVE